MIVMELIVKSTVPVFVKVMVCGGLVVPTSWLVKVSECRDRLITGAMPVPVTGIVCGLSAALSLRLTCSTRLPIAVGAG